jgi:hypothetical protein
MRCGVARGPARPSLMGRQREESRIEVEQDMFAMWCLATGSSTDVLRVVSGRPGLKSAWTSRVLRGQYQEFCPVSGRGSRERAGGA